MMPTGKVFNNGQKYIFPTKSTLSCWDECSETPVGKHVTIGMDITILVVTIIGAICGLLHYYGHLKSSNFPDQNNDSHNTTKNWDTDSFVNTSEVGTLGFN